MKNGYIKIHRTLLEWEWFDSAEMVKVFIYLLLSANFEDRKWQGTVIRRGQLLTTRETLANAVGLSVQKLRTCIAKLEQTGEITRKSTKRFSIITISNYDRYQAVEGTSPTNNQPTDNPQSTHPEETSHVRATTIDGSVIYNNINNNNPYSKFFSQPEEKEKEKEREAYKREKVPAKIGGWRFISSMLRTALGNDPEAIAEYKKECIRLELEAVASDTPMTPESKEAFLNKWCEHTPGSEKIRAEFEPTFNVAERAKQFMAWWVRNRSGMATAEEKRMERLNVNDKWK